MASHLQVPDDINATPQTVTDKDGDPTPLQLATSAVIVNSGGKLGIGTTAPQVPLHTGPDSGVRFELGSSANFSIGGTGMLSVDAPGVPSGRFVVTNHAVGINQPDPQFNLDVNGIIRTLQLVVMQMRPESTKPPGTRLLNVLIDTNTGILYRED